MIGASDITSFSEVELRHPRDETIGRIGFGLVVFSVFPVRFRSDFAAPLAQEKLHPEKSRGGGGAVEVAGEAMLEAIARRRELLAQTVHLVLC